MPVRLPLLTMPLLTLGLLAGCGGGGGDSKEPVEFTVTPPSEAPASSSADLRMVAINAPATATAGGELTLSAEVENVGAEAAADDVGQVSGGVFLSADAEIDPQHDLYIGAIYFTDAGGPGLAPGDKVTRTVTIELPSTLGTGDYYVGVYADHRWVFEDLINKQAGIIRTHVDDSDRSNNAIAAPGQVALQGSQACSPDQYEDDEAGRVVGLGTETHNLCLDSSDVFLLNTTEGQQISLLVQEVDDGEDLIVSLWNEAGEVEQVATTDRVGQGALSWTVDRAQTYRIEVAHGAVRNPKSVYVPNLDTGVGISSEYHISIQ